MSEVLAQLEKNGSSGGSVPEFYTLCLGYEYAQSASLIHFIDGSVVGSAHINGSYSVTCDGLVVAFDGWTLHYSGKSCTVYKIVNGVLTQVTNGQAVNQTYDFIFYPS